MKIFLVGGGAPDMTSSHWYYKAEALQALHLPATLGEHNAVHAFSAIATTWIWPMSREDLHAPSLQEQTVRELGGFLFGLIRIRPDYGSTHGDLVDLLQDSNGHILLNAPLVPVPGWDNYLRCRRR